MAVYDGLEPSTVQATQLAVVNLLPAAGGPLHSTTLRLAQNQFQPGRNLTLPGLTEATFDGYTPVAISAWTSAYLDAQGLARTDGSTSTFISTDGVVTNTIYGWYVTSGAGSAEVLVEAALFPAPIQITQANQGVTVVPTYAYGD